VSDRFRNEVVRIADLTVNTNTIEAVEFSNCQIIGPAVLVPQGSSSFISCTWPGSVEAIFWEIPSERTHVIGAVAAVDCTFSECRFVEVGLAGTGDLRQCSRRLQRCRLTPGSVDVEPRT
jgi:hypothetical protein